MSGAGKESIAIGEAIVHLVALSKLTTAEEWQAIDPVLTDRIERFRELFRMDVESDWEFIKNTHRNATSKEIISAIDDLMKESVIPIVTTTNRRILAYFQLQDDLFQENRSIERHKLAQSLAEVFSTAWQTGWYQRNLNADKAISGESGFDPVPKWIGESGEGQKAIYLKALRSQAGTSFSFPVHTVTTEQKTNYVRELNRNIPKNAGWRFGKRNDVFLKILTHKNTQRSRHKKTHKRSG